MRSSQDQIFAAFEGDKWFERMLIQTELEFSFECVRY